MLCQDGASGLLFFVCFDRSFEKKRAPRYDGVTHGIIVTMRFAVDQAAEVPTDKPSPDTLNRKMAVILANALGQPIEAKATTDLLDDKDIPAWAKGSVAYVK